MTDNNSRGQRTHKCDIIGCEEQGRVLARLGGVPISYCPIHRKKYGERIIDALINSRFNYKLTNFLSTVKSDVFMSDDFFCEQCGSALGSYIVHKTVELEELLDFQKRNDAQLDDSLK